MSSPYWTPSGGLPPQTRQVADRAVFTTGYVVIPRGVLSDIVVSQLPFWNNTTFSANTSLIKSTVDLPASSNPYDTKRPMQGQSPYLVNLSLTYADTEANWSSTILFNRIGQRIETVGAFGIPDVYENGRSVLDFQLAKKVFKNKGEIKINMSNLLNTRQIFYNNVESQKDNRAYNSQQDRVQWSNLFGSSYGVGFSYNF